MIVAVNTRFLLPDQLEGYGYFLQETFRRITGDHPEHRFIFIFDRPYDDRFLFHPNVEGVVVPPPARHPLLWKWWYDVKLPAVLRKYKADLFVSCDGFISLRTRVPQFLLVHDLSFLHYPAFNLRSHARYYKKYTPLFLRKATKVATVSAFSRNDIAESYKMDPAAIDVVYSAAKSSFKITGVSERDQVKAKYTEGKEFFLYTGAIHPRKNLLNLLRAFSVFKRRQQSNWKLVLAGRLAWKNDEFLSKLATFKYRQDVIMTGYLPESELNALMGAAYALVYVPLWEGFGVPPLEAMQCGIPVLTSRNSPMQEIAGDAALYADPENSEDIADAMMRLYKDEQLRSELVARSKAVVNQYNWDRTAALLWESMMKAVI